MNKTKPTFSTPEREELLNIYDRLASLGRAMQRAADSQKNNSMGINIQKDKTIELRENNLTD